MWTGHQVKNIAKQLVIRSLGLFMATFAGGMALGAVGGDWVFGALIGVGSAFVVVVTTIGVSLAWKGSLAIQDIENAYRAAVAKSDSEAVKDALEVNQDGKFDYDDIEYEDSDPELQ
jgi:hypothetical protein